MPVILPPPDKTKLQTVSINGYDIRFIHKPCRKDSAHLLVLLNGYRHGGWEFENSINFFKCSVLMIADVFKNGQSCYLGSNRTLEFSDAVAGLIHAVLKSLLLTSDDCTLIGPSKGGFAALYIGLKYNFKNIVAPAFVGHIGSWMVRYAPDIAKHVMGADYGGETVAEYDALLLNLIEKDAAADKNIYVFLSEADNFYRELGQREVTQALGRKYPNLNVLFAESDLVFQHDQVTPYFLQEILSITGLLTQNIVTKLENRFVGNMLLASAVLPDERSKAVFSARKSRQNTQPKPVSSIDRLYTNQGIMFLEGLLYLQGCDAPNFKYLFKNLKLKPVDALADKPVGEYEFPLGSVPKRPVNRDLFENVYVDYTAAGTATMNLEGINLQGVVAGRYEILLSVAPDDRQRNYIAPQLTFATEHRDCDGVYEYRISSQKEAVFLTKQPVVNIQETARIHFSLDDFWTKGMLFHIEGAFLVKGVDLSEYHVGRYYCVVRHVETGRQYSAVLGQMKKEKLGEDIGNFTGGYRACYFASMNLKGIDSAGFELGKYEVYVSLAYESEIFSYKINPVLEVSNSGCRFV